MKTYMLCRDKDGILLDQRVVVSGESLLWPPPEGHRWIEGAHDNLAVQFDVMTGCMVRRLVPPQDTEWVRWEWSSAAGRWSSMPTHAARARDVRAERDRRLAACDWVVTRSIDRGEPMPAAWSAYRQALRDVTQQPGFPDTLNWPEAPA